MIIVSKKTFGRSKIMMNVIMVVVTKRLLFKEDIKNLLVQIRAIALHN